MTFNEYAHDKYLTDVPEEKALDYCSECGCELYEGDAYWNIKGDIYCKQCIDEAKGYIERYEED